MSEAASKSDKPLTEVETAPSAYRRFRVMLVDARAELRKNGLKGLFRRYGWKLFAIIFVYYLVRDIILYIVLPWLVARHLLAN